MRQEVVFMSRGLGKVEREVLSVLENTPGACLWLSTLRERLYPAPPITGEAFSDERLHAVLVRSELRIDTHWEAVNRAVRRLDRRGLVGTAYWRWRGSRIKSV
jgi:hypothetical protein